MNPVPEPVDAAAPADAAPAHDLLADLGAPDFACWASGEDLTPPDLTALPVCESEPPALEPAAFAWDAPVEEPPIFGSPAVADYSTDPSPAPARAPTEETPTRAPAPAEAPVVAESGEERPLTAATPPTDQTPLPTRSLVGGPAPADPPDWAAAAVERRARLRDFAARLWTDAPQAETAGDLHLICTLGGEDFALPLGRLVEVLRFPGVTAVPHTPQWLLGVTNRRGEILSVVDLAAFLGLPPSGPSPHRRLVVIRAGDGLTTGLAVDRVRGIRGIKPGAVAPPLFAVPHVRGLCEADGECAAVLDLDDLLQSGRLRRLGPG